MGQVAAGILLLNLSGVAAPGYETGFSNIVRIATDLQHALPPAARQNLSPTPVLLDNVSIPFLQPGEQMKPNVVQYVSVSRGFVDFANYLSHAKAIDEYQQGVYRRYLETLASQPKPPPLLVGVGTGRAWSFDTRNHQVSQFNQIVAGLIAVEMAHHYLGHYRKYAPRLVDAQGHAISINNYLTPDEWHAAVLKGGRNALDCGFSPDGIKIVLDAFEGMKVRPSWAIYLVPRDVDARRLNRDLTTLEKTFFTSLQK